ncbi:hypothetical protein BS78_K094600 [Paspalum vaginatum]|uniref:Uncharacterized protein n=1 Tax=Paspalum vaginatum TaxID=158149 RepID=A0A9W8CFQ0_9POAL|nr:hypothetical protein BS78_K094600 [Paspalum vaginatum]
MSGGHVVYDESTTEKNGGGGVMRMHVVVVCSAVGFIGFVVVIIGVAGEAATAQALDDTASLLALRCVYRATPALGCGIAAALLALMAEGVVTAATVICCACFRPIREVPTQAKRIVSIALFAVSWIIVVIVVALFIAGAALNGDHVRELNADFDCDHDPGSPMFAAATVLSVLATAMQIGSYILLQATPTAGSTKPPATQQPELAMGQPVQPEHLQERDAEEEVVADSAPPPPSAPPLSRHTEPTSQVP